MARRCSETHIWILPDEDSGLREDPKNLHFTTVLGVRRPREKLHFTTVLGVRRSLFALWVARQRDKFAFHHSFGHPTSTKWRAGCLPPRPTKPTLRKRKEETLKRRGIFEEQRSQQLFSAGFLSSLSQQLFSAGFLSSFSQQPFSAALLSSSSQQPFSAALLSSSSQQPFSAALLGSSSQLSSCCGQGLVVS